MQIEIAFTMTASAHKLAHSSGMPQTNFGWPSPDLATVPIAGDTFSIGGESAPVFEVSNRMFIWRSPQHLVIQLLLDDPASR